MDIALKINKVVDGKDDNKSHIEIDTINLQDLISYRNWHKKGRDNDVEGPMTQLTLISHGRDGGMWTVRINESESEFENRIKEYIQVIGLA